MRTVGTVVRGIRTPIIKEGDNLKQIVIDSILKAKDSEKFEFHDKDIIAITEAVVGITEGNYATVDQIASDIKNKYKDGILGLVFPILSRNRFATQLKGTARGAKKLYILLSYPSDEVGNNILNEEDLKKYDINPYSYTFTTDEYKEKFGDFKHIFTGVNMVQYYTEIVNSEDCEVEFVFSNNPETILEYTDNVLICDIHTREKTKNVLKNAKTIYDLTEILNTSIDGSGCNPTYGLLGSNKATEEKLKLFPAKGQTLVEEIQNELKQLTGKTIEVMIYGDGAFKDPVGGIWELADPVVSPAYTSGLEGTPNEIKLKYISDNKLADLKGEELANAMKEIIKSKQKDLKGKNESLGTTPRRLTDLIGSLCDLSSGSGDKGTPIVFIQGYFDNYAD